MQHAFNRLDLNDIADWIRLPIRRICTEHNLTPLDDTTLVNLAELMVDFDINSRLSWTGHSDGYRLDDFCNIFGSAYLNNDNFYSDFDELRCVVSEYLERRLQPLMGKLWGNHHVYELRRLNGWLVIIDIGVSSQQQRRASQPQAHEAVERRGGLEIRRYSAGEAVIYIRNGRPSSERKQEIVPMGTIKMNYRPTESRVIRPPEDITDEQFEWLAEVEQRRAACNKKYPAPETTASNLRAGELHKRKRSIVRSKLGIIRSEKNDLYFDPYRDGYTFVSSDELDDNKVREASERRTSPFRPVRRQRRSSRRHSS